MAQHAFVAMPYGKKKGIDFNKIYSLLIKPALEAAGFEAFRADEELRAGNIRTDMFQELLLADLVVVDLSIDNPNVWYELGVRHALRERGVMQIQCGRKYMPFDVYVDRTLSYHVKRGVPDAEHLEKDRKAIAEFAMHTMQAKRERKTSPVYQLLPYLREPEWKTLRVDKVKEFWKAHEAWKRRIEEARSKDRPGDIMVLAAEAPIRVLGLEAHRSASMALRSLGQYKLALDEIERALMLEPDDLQSGQLKGVLLERLGRHDSARLWLEALGKTDEGNAETSALLGRVSKEAWIDSWRGEGRTVRKRREAARDEDGLLGEAITCYRKGFEMDPRHYYSGINAATLMHVRDHLAGRTADAKGLDEVVGGTRWAILSALGGDRKDYWARATLGELEVLTNGKRAVERAYKDAVAVANKDRFKLDSSRQQLLILKELGFRPTVVSAALRILDRALDKLKKPKGRWQPDRVFLFSGHMIDAPGRKQPRFPPDKEEIAANAIGRRLDRLKAGPSDLALCGGACGGDLLFAEACLERGLRLEVRIPLEEPAFLKESVSFAAGRWRDRYFRVKRHGNSELSIMPSELGPSPSGVNHHARNNLWQLHTALSWGPEKVRFLCLWDRKAGDGPGGTKDMHDTVRRYSGRVYVMDTRKLW